MASRFYLLSENASGAVPNAKQSADTITREAASSYATYASPARMGKQINSNNRENYTNTAEPGSSPYPHYHHYGSWVSDPLDAQTTGTWSVTISLSMREGSGNANAYPRVKIYKWLANDTFGADILAIITSGTEITGTTSYGTQTFFSSQSCTNTTFAAGDRIVIEIESEDQNTKTSAYYEGIQFDGSSTYQCYVEFSVDLKLQHDNITKALAYKVLTKPSATTKTLAYKVKSSPTYQRTLAYKVKTIPSTYQKTLSYKVKTIPSTIQKGLVYAVFVAQYYTYQRTLAYKVKSSPTYQRTLAYIVKSYSTYQRTLSYKVLYIASAIQKSMAYKIIKIPSTTKGLKYTVPFNYTSQKGLIYRVPKWYSTTKSLAFKVLRIPSAIQNGLVYRVLTIPSTVQNTLAYKVLKTSAPTKDLDYVVLVTYTIQKGMQYSVPGGSNWYTVQKDLDYLVKATNSTTKDLDYFVLNMYTIEKGLVYKILLTDTIQKDMDYVVPAPTVTIQKSLSYSVLVDEITIYKKIGDGDWEALTTVPFSDCSTIDNGPFTYELTYHYKAQRIHTIDGGTSIYLPMSNEDDVVIHGKLNIEKSLIYKVFLTFSIQKSLIYRVLTVPSSIQKDLDYAVTPLYAPWIDSTQVLNTIEISWWWP